MYRDDPLDDELELRELLGDDPVDQLLDGAPGALEGCLDALRILQGWVDDQTAAAWFTDEQRRLDGRTPVEALVDGDVDDVREAAGRWGAAQG